MKKLGKRLLIVLIIVAVLYGGYMIFINPSGYTDKEKLATDFFENIDNANACTTYFAEETTDYCESFVALFDGETITVEDTRSTSSGVTVTISIDGNEDDFLVTFIAEVVTVIKVFFNSRYYYIDVIQ
jgi:hypothetical protein